MTDELRSFVMKSIDSLSLVEVLLLLFRDRAREWSAEDLSRELRSSPKSVETQLEKLRALGLAGAPSGGRVAYRSPSPGMDRLMAELAEQFGTRRNSLIDMIYRDRGSDDIRDFANAFKWRKD